MVTIRVEMDMSIKVLIMMIGDLYTWVTLVVAYAYNGTDALDPHGRVLHGNVLHSLMPLF